MRALVGILSALFAASVLGSANAQDLGREWKALDAAMTTLVFNAPGLERAGKRFLWSQAPNYSHSLEVGIWSSPSTLFPKAQIILQRLAPGYVYNYRIDLEANIKRYRFLKDKSVSIEPEKSTSNELGNVKYRPFSFDNLECVAFGQNFGRLMVDDYQRDLSGSDLLAGFYCGDPGELLSADAIVQVLKGIGLKRS